MKRIFIVLMMVLTISLSAADWPVYRNGHYRDGITTDTVVPSTLKLSWSYSDASTPRQAWGGAAKWDSYAKIYNLRNMRNYDPVYHPVIADGKLYFSSTGDDTLYCLNAESGDLIWKFELNAPSRIAPSVYDGRVFLGSDDGNVFCVDAAKGVLIWKYRAVEEFKWLINDARMISPFPVRTGIMVEQGKAYFGVSLLPWKASYLCCLNANNGKEIYKREFPDQQCTMEGSLSAVDGKLVIPQGRIAPRLFDMSNGDYLGSLPGGNGCYTFVTEDKTILTGPLARGKAFQELQADKEGSSVSTYEDGNAVLVRSGIAYLLSDHSIKAIKRSTGSTVWELRGEYPYDLILADGLLFAGGEDKIAAIESATGKVIWEADVSGKAYGLAVANGNLYVSTDEGRVYCFSQKGTQPVKNSREAIASLKNKDLVSSYLFNSKNINGDILTDLAGNRNAELEGALNIQGKGKYQSLSTGNALSDVLIYTDMKSNYLPKKSLTASAWVKIDKAAEKGGILGIIDDSSSSLKGWMLGYSGNFFSFKLRTKNGNGLETVIATAPFELGTWYQVTATYNGKEASIFINGQKSASLLTAGGEILYPESGYYAAAVWRDQDDYLPMVGALHQVDLYSVLFSDDEIRSQYDPRFAAGLAYSRPIMTAETKAGPFWKFTSHESAEVSWMTENETPSRLFYGEKVLDQSAGDGELRRDHRVTLHGIRKDRLYRYYVSVRTSSGLDARSDELAAESFFNYTLEGDATNVNCSPQWLKTAETLVEASGLKGTLSVVIGSANSDAVIALAKASQGRVIVLAVDPANVIKVRKKCRMEGIYGDRVKVLDLSSENINTLPTQFASNILFNVNPDSSEAKLLLSSSAINKAISMIRPDGGVLMVSANSASLKGVKKSLDSSAINYSLLNGNLMVKQVPLPGACSWSHGYGTAGNATFTGETLQGVRSTDDMKVQWIGKPGARYQTDRNGRKVPPVAENGRLYLQGDNRIICLDQYSGSILWAIETPEINRMNMPRDTANWFADDNGLYLATRDHLCNFDGKTGALTKVLPLTLSSVRHDQEWSFVAGPVLDNRDLIAGTASIKGTSYFNIWGAATQGWYDATVGKVTNKVVSDNFFVMNRKTDDLLWKYEKGLIVNSTLTIDKNRVIFLELRSKSKKKKRNRRLSWSELKRNLFIVCLDLNDGSLEWEKKFSIKNATTMINGAQAEGYYAISGSGMGRYYTKAFAVEDGKSLWSANVKWPKDNHGGHMSKPVIVNGRVYVRPAYYDLASGKELGKDQPVQAGGCSTYAATSEMIIFRSGDLCLWDPLDDKEISRWNRLRQDCWLSTIPSDGMILSPEGGGGCSCGNWMETSVGFIPRQSEIGKGVLY